MQRMQGAGRERTDVTGMLPCALGAVLSHKYQQSAVPGGGACLAALAPSLARR